MPDDPETIAFRDCTLDLRFRVLSRAGVPLKLGEPAFDLLVCLIRNRDHVATRTEIEACVWPGRAVGAGNLPTQLSLLRDALGADKDLILTVVGRGYRFVGNVVAPAPEPPAFDPATAPVSASMPALPVEPVAGGAPAAPVATRRIALPALARRRLPGAVVLAALAALVLAGALGWQQMRAPHPPRLSIAVLPLRDFSDKGAGGYMADAVTDDLNTGLSHIPGSIVIARESADAYRDHGAKADKIGRKLDVRYILVGSLRTADTTVHVNVQLIEAAADREAWADMFDVPGGRLTDMQSAIVRHVISGVERYLTDAASAEGQHDRPDNPNALDLFYHARSMLEADGSLKSFADAQRLLERAVALEPAYGDALSALGLTLVLKVRSVDDPDADADLARARVVIATALRLPGPPPGAMAAQARLNETDGDCDQAEQNAEAALHGEPNSIDALAVLARCKANEGKLDESASYIEQILRLNPIGSRNKPRYLGLSQTRVLQGRYAEAIDLAYQALAGDPEPQQGADSMGRAEYARLLLISAFQLSGKSAQAAARYQSYAAIWPHRSVWRIAGYSPSGLAGTPGFIRFLSGLEAAGMPRYADEHEAAETIPAGVASNDDFAPVPSTLPGCTTLDTRQLAAMVQSHPPAILDLGQGAAVMPGAALFKRGRSPQKIVDWIDAVLAQLQHGERGQPVVVMGTGVYGAAALNGARHLVAAGYRHVFWYRGGEEAWARAGLPSADQRLAD